ncbi:MAG: hypothetical protein GDA36_05025 [Rhodobacteraceae bacterium]|nr:hypothetical protein [Paracoccaceae bacterium]
MHFSADTQARRIKKGSKRTPGYEDDIQVALCARTRSRRKSFIDKVHTGTCEPGQP